MKNWKTTLSGLISVLGFILPQFGIGAEIANAVQTIGVACIGYFASDTKKGV